MQELYKTSSIYSGFSITTWDIVSAISMFSLFSRVTKEHFTPLCLADCIAVLIVLNTSSYWFHLSAQLHFLVLKCTTCIACVCAHICAIFLGVTQTEYYAWEYIRLLHPIILLCHGNWCSEPRWMHKPTARQNGATQANLMLISIILRIYRDL